MTSDSWSPLYTSMTFNSTTGLFNAQPSVDSNGVLTYTPKPGVFGVANLSLTLQDNGGTANSGADTTSLSIASTVAVTPANDAPVLTATAAGGTFAEGSATSLFSGTAVSTIETGQTITSLTFTVSNVLDATEEINVDGATVALTNGATGSTTTNSMSYTVTVSSGTATVVLTKVSGVSAANIQTLVDGMSYQNTATDNPTAGDRVPTTPKLCQPRYPNRNRSNPPRTVFA